MAAPQGRNNTSGFNAYATLVTRPTYMAGAVLLAYTLHKHSPSTPLIMLYTPESLPPSSIRALEREVRLTSAVLWRVAHLRVPDGEAAEHGHVTDGEGMVAERFMDTWTKLRVFDMLEVGGKKVERLCFLDADMMVFADPSPLVFNEETDAFLRSEDGLRLAATHVCVCNLDADAWAPPSWTPSNCAFTPLTSSAQLAAVHPASDTMGLFNSGAFAFRPSPALGRFVSHAFQHTPAARLRALKFPDQDFLNQVFARRWTSLSWRVNALKTWRCWHRNIWDDGEVVVLHYIVDKPWAERVREDGSAGYRGLDGVTHGWWWAEFERWKGEREEQGEEVVLEEVMRWIAGGGEEMRAVGGGAQDFARKWDADAPVPRTTMLGERGQEPVVHR